LEILSLSGFHMNPSSYCSPPTLCRSCPQVDCLACITGLAHWRWADKQWTLQDFKLDVFLIATSQIQICLAPNLLIIYPGGLVLITNAGDQNFTSCHLGGVVSVSATGPLTAW